MAQAHKISTPREALNRQAAVDGLLDPEVFAALADPTRVRLFACLLKCGRACSVTEVAGCCSVDLSVVSRHLAALHRVRIVTQSKVGRSVMYRADAEGLATRLRLLADAIAEWPSDASACGEGACCGENGDTEGACEDGAC